MKANPTGQGFYVASRASLPERPAMWQAFRARGFLINSSWIDEAGPGETANMTELWTRIENEVRCSEALILYVESEDFPLKGALIEVGIALGAGVPVRVVAPGVKLEAISFRPLGSWVNHPNVTLHDTVEEAFDW